MLCKEKVNKKELVILVGIVVAIILLVCINAVNILESPLRNIESETEVLPNYVIYNTLSYGNKEVHIGSICERKKYHLKEIFCVKNDHAFFVYSAKDEGISYWAIGSVNLENQQFQTHCKLLEPEDVYKKHKRFLGDYQERNGFYYNGEIVLNDYKKVLVYNLDSQKVTTCDFQEYDFPKEQKIGKFMDEETVCLNLDGNSRIFTLREMAEKSDSIFQLYALKDKTIWDGTSLLQSFFGDESVQWAGDKVYAIGQCLNKKGYAYAVILEYDAEKDLWRYVTSKRSAAGDIVHGRCYVIPQV